MITPSIVAENLTKGYGSFTALSNLNLKNRRLKVCGLSWPERGRRDYYSQDPYPTTLSQGEAFAPYASIPEGIAIVLTYFVVTALLGLVLFERKEFT